MFKNKGKPTVILTGTLKKPEISILCAKWKINLNKTVINSVNYLYNVQTTCATMYRL